AERGDEQNQVSIPIHVREQRAGRILIRTSHPSGWRNVFELPVATIAVEHVRPFQPAKKKINQTVAIDIANGDTRTAQSVLVLSSLGIRQMICKHDPGEARRLSGETGFARLRRSQFNEAEACPHLPIERSTDVVDQHKGEPSDYYTASRRRSYPVPGRKNVLIAHLILTHVNTCGRPQEQNCAALVTA